MFQCAQSQNHATWVFEGDIRGCFDYLSHEWMLDHIPTDTEVLRRWLSAGYVENRTVFPTEAGTPQGGIISPTLANMTLDGLEQLLKVAFPRRRDGARNTGSRLTSFVMRMTSSSPARPRTCWKMKSVHWSNSFCATGVCSSRQKKPASVHRRRVRLPRTKPPQVWGQAAH